MHWDKRGILKIYNFCRRGRQGLAARSAALVKGGILLVEENTPFGIPRDNEGTPLDPALSVPARNHCTRCAKNCLRFPVAAFDLVCAYVRSAAAAAGLRRRFIPSLLGKPARLYKIRSPAAASRRSTAHTAHRLSYPRHTSCRENRSKRSFSAMFLSTTTALGSIRATRWDCRLRSTGSGRRRRRRPDSMPPSFSDFGCFPTAHFLTFPNSPSKLYLNILQYNHPASL